MSLTRLLRRTTDNCQSGFLLLLPHGGQGAARRNAWGAMAVDASRARARREASLAMARAVARHEVAATG